MAARSHPFVHVKQEHCLVLNNAVYLELHDGWHAEEQVFQALRLGAVPAPEDKAVAASAIQSGHAGRN